MESQGFAKIHQFRIGPRQPLAPQPSAQPTTHYVSRTMIHQTPQGPLPLAGERATPCIITHTVHPWPPPFCDRFASQASTSRRRNRTLRPTLMNGSPSLRHHRSIAPIQTFSQSASSCLLIISSSPPWWGRRLFFFALTRGISSLLSPADPLLARRLNFHGLLHSCDAYCQIHTIRVYLPVIKRNRPVLMHE